MAKKASSLYRVPLRRHPWYPQGAYLFRRSRLHAPAQASMGFGGYTHGSYDPVTPYAYQPKHTGLDGFAGDAPVPGCGVNDLVNYIVGLLPSGFSVSTPLGNTTISLSPAYSVAKQEVYKWANTNFANLGKWADYGAAYVAQQISAQISTPIVKALFASSLPSVVKAAGATLVTQALDNVLRKKLYTVGAKLRECAGKAPAPGAPTISDAAGYLTAGQLAAQEAAKKAYAIDQTMEFSRYATEQIRQDKSVLGPGAGAGLTRAGADLQIYRPTDSAAAAPSAGGAGGIALLGGAALAALMLLR